MTDVGGRRCRLADVVIFNDTNDYDSAGDVEIYRSVGELLGQLKSWYVEERHSHFILTGKSKPIRLGLEERSSWRGA